MADKNIKYENIDKSQFQFVQDEKKIFDKKFETKPIGYFKDAMMRFAKNKTNLTASIILLTLILLSVFVPIFSTKNAEKLEETLSYLPPRIPYLEDIGIADGTKMRYDQPVDPSTIDPETGLGLPYSTLPKYIDMSTLENYYGGCTDKDAQCVGGQNEIMKDNNKTGAIIRSNTWLSFSKIYSSKIVIDVYNISDEANSKLLVQVGPIAGQYVTIGEITAPGVYTFDPYLDNPTLPASGKIQLRYETEDINLRASLNSVSIVSETEDASEADQLKYNYSVSGYELSQYQLVSEVILNDEEEIIASYSGTYVRANGLRLMSSFRVDAYAEVFGDKFQLAFPASEYDKLMAEYADVCIQMEDPDNPDGWLFPEGCPIVKVNYQNESVFVPGKGDQFSYNLVLNYQVYAGYEEIPYFFFGTSAAGKDMVKLIFIGLRTSLTIGLIVAFINITIGVIYGAISGYYGGQIDIIMERFAEIIGRIPWLVTLSIFIALIGPGIETLIYVMVISGWIGVASVTRTQFYRYKGREYVLASRTLGAKDARLIFRHILPNGIGTIITSSILMVPALIFTEATLSYLGFGIGHGQSFTILGINMSGVSIGVLLSDGRNQLRQNPHLTLFPAIIISILMITFNMFGNALRDAFNPALRGSE